jgi:hypothetical protein
MDAIASQQMTPYGVWCSLMLTEPAPLLDCTSRKGSSSRRPKTASGRSTCQPSGSVPNLRIEANETFGPGRIFAWPNSRCSDDIPARRERRPDDVQTSNRSSKSFPFHSASGGEDSSSQRTKPLAPTMQGARAGWPAPSVAVPRPSLPSQPRLHPSEIEAMSASTHAAYLPAPTRPLLPDTNLASLACKAPTLCSQLKRMSR